MTIDYPVIKEEIKALCLEKSCNPILVRLAWHDAGTFCATTKTGGPNGSMRFAPIAGHGANAGLKIARDLLQPIKDKHPDITCKFQNADFWSLAGAVAIEAAGGPKIQWRPGRHDCTEADLHPDGRLPDATKGVPHLRDIFYRMGLNDQEIVALSGAHALGRCHKDRSGFEGPWTKNPLKFTNDYFKELVEVKWTKREWDGPLQYQDPSGELMMLPSDLALLDDPKTRTWVEVYAKDSAKFFEDFAHAFQKLLELGVTFPAGTPVF